MPLDNSDLPVDSQQGKERKPIKSLHVTRPCRVKSRELLWENDYNGRKGTPNQQDGEKANSKDSGKYNGCSKVKELVSVGNEQEYLPHTSQGRIKKAHFTIRKKKIIAITSPSFRHTHKCFLRRTRLILSKKKRASSVTQEISDAGPLQEPHAYMMYDLHPPRSVSSGVDPLSHVKEKTAVEERIAEDGNSYIIPQIDSSKNEYLASELFKSDEPNCEAASSDEDETDLSSDDKIEETDGIPPLNNPEKEYVTGDTSFIVIKSYEPNRKAVSADEDETDYSSDNTIVETDGIPPWNNSEKEYVTVDTSFIVIKSYKPNRKAASSDEDETDYSSDNTIVKTDGIPPLNNSEKEYLIGDTSCDIIKSDKPNCEAVSSDEDETGNSSDDTIKETDGIPPLNNSQKFPNNPNQQDGEKANSKDSGKYNGCSKVKKLLSVGNEQDNLPHTSQGRIRKAHFTMRKKNIINITSLSFRHTHKCFLRRTRRILSKKKRASSVTQEISDAGHLQEPHDYMMYDLHPPRSVSSGVDPLSNVKENTAVEERIAEDGHSYIIPQIDSSKNEYLASELIKSDEPNCEAASSDEDETDHSSDAKIEETDGIPPLNNPEKEYVTGDTSFIVIKSYEPNRKAVSADEDKTDHSSDDTIVETDGIPPLNNPEKDYVTDDPCELIRSDEPNCEAVSSDEDETDYSSDDTLVEADGIPPLNNSEKEYVHGDPCELIKSDEPNAKATSSDEYETDYSSDDTLVETDGIPPLNNSEKEYVHGDPCELIKSDEPNAKATSSDEYETDYSSDNTIVETDSIPPLNNSKKEHVIGDTFCDIIKSDEPNCEAVSSDEDETRNSSDDTIKETDSIPSLNNSQKFPNTPNQQDGEKANSKDSGKYDGCSKVKKLLSVGNEQDNLPHTSQGRIRKAHFTMRKKNIINITSLSFRHTHKCFLRRTRRILSKKKRASSVTQEISDAGHLQEPHDYMMYDLHPPISVSSGVDPLSNVKKKTAVEERIAEDGHSYIIPQIDSSKNEYLASDTPFELIKGNEPNCEAASSDEDETDYSSDDTLVETDGIPPLKNSEKEYVHGDPCELIKSDEPNAKATSSVEYETDYSSDDTLVETDGIPPLNNSEKEYVNGDPCEFIKSDDPNAKATSSDEYETDCSSDDTLVETDGIPLLNNSEKEYVHGDPCELIKSDEPNAKATSSDEYETDYSSDDTLVETDGIPPLNNSEKEYVIVDRSCEIIKSDEPNCEAASSDEDETDHSSDDTIVETDGIPPLNNPEKDYVTDDPCELIRSDEPNCEAVSSDEDETDYSSDDTLVETDGIPPLKNSEKEYVHGDPCELIKSDEPNAKATSSDEYETDYSSDDTLVETDGIPPLNNPEKDYVTDDPCELIRSDEPNCEAVSSDEDETDYSSDDTLVETDGIPPLNNSEKEYVHGDPCELIKSDEPNAKATSSDEYETDYSSDDTLVETDGIPPLNNSEKEYVNGDPCELIKSDEPNAKATSSDEYETDCSSDDTSVKTDGIPPLNNSEKEYVTGDPCEYTKSDEPNCEDVSSDEDETDYFLDDTIRLNKREESAISQEFAEGAFKENDNEIESNLSDDRSSIIKNRMENEDPAPHVSEEPSDFNEEWSPEKIIKKLLTEFKSEPNLALPCRDDLRVKECYQKPVERIDEDLGGSITEKLNGNPVQEQYNSTDNAALSLEIMHKQPRKQIYAVDDMNLKYGSQEFADCQVPEEDSVDEGGESETESHNHSPPELNVSDESDEDCISVDDIDDPAFCTFYENYLIAAEENYFNKGLLPPDFNDEWCSDKMVLRLYAEFKTGQNLAPHGCDDSSMGECNQIPEASIDEDLACTIVGEFNENSVQGQDALSNYALSSPDSAQISPVEEDCDVEEESEISKKSTDDAGAQWRSAQATLSPELTHKPPCRQIYAVDDMNLKCVSQEFADCQVPEEDSVDEGGESETESHNHSPPELNVSDESDEDCISVDDIDDPAFCTFYENYLIAAEEKYFNKGLLPPDFNDEWCSDKMVLRLYAEFKTGQNLAPHGCDDSSMGECNQIPEASIDEDLACTIVGEFNENSVQGQDALSNYALSSPDSTQISPVEEDCDVEEESEISKKSTDDAGAQWRSAQATLSPELTHKPPCRQIYAVDDMNLKCVSQEFADCQVPEEVPVVESGIREIESECHSPPEPNFSDQCNKALMDASDIEDPGFWSFLANYSTVAEACPVSGREFPENRILKMYEIYKSEKSLAPQPSTSNEPLESNEPPEYSLESENVNDVLTTGDTPQEISELAESVAESPEGASLLEQKVDEERASCAEYCQELREAFPEEDQLTIIQGMENLRVFVTVFHDYL